MDPPLRPAAGVVSSIRLENFMCHNSLQIQLCDWVNFITGQNGSGKSAILTALCVAFGCRARGTQRATSLKDFIKTGCSYASVCIKIKNEGGDAFKPETYGDLIMLERRITESSSTTTLKDYQGKKVSQKKGELRELVEHFNIDVENPCVIMSQDKSREFLHSGNDKDKFKFFFKATLLQQVNDLLQSIRSQLDSANAAVDELEASIRPIQKELGDLREKIKNMEHVEEIAQQVQILKKKLAWSWVYDVDKQIQEQNSKLGILRDRIPTCQARIDKQSTRLEELKGLLVSKKSYIASLMENTSDVRRVKDELQHDLSLATKEKYELEEEYARKSRSVENMAKRASLLQKQVDDIQQQHIKNTQAEETEFEELLRRIQNEFDAVQSRITRLQSVENDLSETVAVAANAVKDIAKEVEEHEAKHRDISYQIRQLQQRQKNKVTAFGGERVLSLLRVVERRCRGFESPPIGPIGAHLTLRNGDFWALAVESALGRLLDAFIVTDNKDAQLLRRCAKEANYHSLQIVIYDFSMPRLNIPEKMLPSTNHPTILSVLQVDNSTVMNVLVDLGNVERHVLVRDYEMGKSVAFEQRIQNLRDVYTADGIKMFRRGNVETVLPPNRRGRAVRLCGSVDDHIYECEKESLKVQALIQEGKKRKRSFEGEVQELNVKMQSIKRQRVNEQSILTSKEVKLRDVKSTYATVRNADPAPDVELNQEILKVEEDIRKQEISMAKVQNSIQRAEEKVNGLKIAYEKLCDSAKGEVDAIEQSEQELLLIEQDIRSAEGEKAHYKRVMNDKVLADIKKGEEQYRSLQHDRQENFEKASIICPEHEVESLGGCAGSNPEQLSNLLKRLKQRLQQETERYTESLEDLRMMHAKKERKIMKKQRTYDAFHEKLNACQKALDMRWSKFQRNANLLKRQLTWQFNGHLRKKGFSGQIKVDYDEKTLSVEVKMPQDASGKTIRDTRGLSGGERSFSTLCFALALHEMTEAPFRAMDEFDVFMDAISRKISLATLVDFALSQGSQWIFITPHDISMVKPGERIKKQQMAAPRA